MLVIDVVLPASRKHWLYYFGVFYYKLLPTCSSHIPMEFFLDIECNPTHLPYIYGILPNKRH